MAERMYMKQILMCDPKHFTVSYEINPWMNEQINNVDISLANNQWNELYKSISAVAQVKVLDGVDKLPDLVFTANAGFVYNKTAILSNFSKEQRKPEEKYFRQWFLKSGYTVVQPTNSYEGEGDHLLDKNGNHWVGTGFRTSNQSIAEIEYILNKKVNRLELVDPRWYHLDTAFCPLPNGEILYYPGAFSEESVKKIRASFVTKVEISYEDAIMFSCNCVCLGQNLFIPKNYQVSDNLRKLGYIVKEFELSEFMKSGGAAKCLVLHCN